MKTIMAAGGLALALAGVMATAAADPGGRHSAQPSAGTSADISGGSVLLDAGRAAQLARWLGAGDIRLDKVYSLAPGDSAADFHKAADGKGATFTLLNVSNPAGHSYLVGGYDPQSWTSDGSWHETPRDWQRTAFLFNMTVPAVYRQILSTYQLPSLGLRQTFDDVGLGPVFGSGPDLYVNDRLDGALSWQLSYGNPGDEGASIIDGSLHGETVRLDAMEVFAISPVPEPGMAAMLLLGASLLVVRARAPARRPAGGAGRQKQVARNPRVTPAVWAGASRRHRRPWHDGWESAPLDCHDHDPAHRPRPVRFLHFRSRSGP